MNLLEKSDQEILEIAEPMWDDLIESSNKRDYLGFIKHFSKEMLMGANEIEIGKGYIVVEGKDLAILNLGTRLDTCLEACKILNENNIYPTVADARFAKPLDTKLIDLLIENHKFLITIEEGSIGGFASHVLNYIHNVRRKNSSTILSNIFFPDRFIDHMTSEEQYREIDMDVNSIIQKIKSLYDDKVIDITNFNFNNKF